MAECITGELNTEGKDEAVLGEDNEEEERVGKELVTEEGAKGCRENRVRKRR